MMVVVVVVEVVATFWKINKVLARKKYFKEVRWVFVKYFLLFFFAFFTFFFSNLSILTPSLCARALLSLCVCARARAHASVCKRVCLPGVYAFFLLAFVICCFRPFVIFFFFISLSYFLFSFCLSFLPLFFLSFFRTAFLFFIF